MLDLLIIGAGPAGLTAALYASRAGLTVKVLDKSAPGGKLNLTAEIENYPGSIKKGPELAYSMFEHCLSFGAEYEYGDVQEIKKVDDHFVTVTDTEIESKYVIIATGTVERKMGIEKEEALTGKGVSYCAVCDGPFYKGKEVAVIGGGNSAIEEAIYLSTVVEKVHVIVRRDVLRADQYIVSKAQSKENIIFHYLKKPYEIIEENNKVAGLKIIDSNTEEIDSLNVSGIFPFIGLDPITDFVSSLHLTNTEGYIEVDENKETKEKGLFAVGDVTNKKLRQVVTACSDGAIAGQYIASLCSK